MMKARIAFFSNERGTAAAEMALVAPLLIVLMFGALETGKFFWDEHIVVKAVRDAARFAARQSFDSMPCGGTAANDTAIKNVAMYGEPTVGASDHPRLYYWTDPTTVTVSITCYDNSGTDGDRVYDGVYADRGEVPQVTVTAVIPYSPLVGGVSSLISGAHVGASDQAVVFGL